MTIEIGPVNSLTELKPELIKKVLEGRFYNLKRVIVLEADEQFYAVTCTIFERIKAAFLKIFCIDYFQDILGTKECKVVDCEILKNILKDIAPAVTPETPAATDAQAPKAAAQAVAPAEAAISTPAKASKLRAGAREWVVHIKSLIQMRPNNHVIYLQDLSALGMGRYQDVMDAIDYMLNVEHTIYARGMGRGGNPLIKVRQDDVVTEPEYDQGWMTRSPDNKRPQVMSTPVPVAVSSKLRKEAQEWVDHIKSLIQMRPNNHVIYLHDLSALGMGRYQDVLEAIDYMLNVEHTIYARGMGRGGNPQIKVRQDDVVTELEYDQDWITCTNP